MSLYQKTLIRNKQKKGVNKMFIATLILIIILYSWFIAPIYKELLIDDMGE